KKLLTGENSGAAEISDQDVIDAWNALLLEFPPERIGLLKELKSRYRLFLFSNTNAIHYNKFRQMYHNSFSGELEDLFEKAYFSHSLGHRKPDTGGFELIIKENRLDPKQTLFVDDAFINVEGALKVGL